MRIAVRLAFVRKCSHRGAGARTVWDIDGFGTDCRRTGIGQLRAVGGGAGPPQPEGHHTSQRPGILASAASAALVVPLAAPLTFLAGDAEGKEPLPGREEVKFADELGSSACCVARARAGSIVSLPCS